MRASLRLGTIHHLQRARSHTAPTYASTGARALHRRRRLAVGLVLFAIASGAGWFAVAGAGNAATVARAAAPSAVSIAAAIAADGTTATPSDGSWASRKVDVGRYELVFGHDVDLAVRSWESLADVTVQPLTDDVWLITFVADEVPVDTAFTFSAAPPP